MTLPASKKPVEKFYEEDLTKNIIGAMIEVHKCLGPGLLESAYQTCLAHELILRKIPFEKEKPVSLIYKGERVNCGFRADFIIDKKVVVELKAVEQLLPIHEAQLLTYLRLTSIKVGLLVNFNTKYIKDSIKRLVL